jgi:hypothetical protein
MSRYLVERIAELPIVKMHMSTDIAALERDGTKSLTAVVFSQSRTDKGRPEEVNRRVVCERSFPDAAPPTPERRLASALS